MDVAVDPQRIGPGARAAQDLGVAAIVGGNLFARIGMNPALREVTDERERGKVVNSAWRRYGTINSIGLAALVTGWAGSRLDEASRRQSERERTLALARDVAVAAVAATGIAAAIEGVRFARMQPAGAVPLEDGGTPADDASPGESRAKDRLNVLGALHLGASLVLVGVNAALRDAASVARGRRPQLLGRG